MCSYVDSSHHRVLYTGPHIYFAKVHVKLRLWNNVVNLSNSALPNRVSYALRNEICMFFEGFERVSNFQFPRNKLTQWWWWDYLKFSIVTLHFICPPYLHRAKSLIAVEQPTFFRCAHILGINLVAWNSSK